MQGGKAAATSQGKRRRSERRPIRAQSAVTRLQFESAAGIAATALLGTTLEARGSSNVSLSRHLAASRSEGGTLQLALTDTEEARPLTARRPQSLPSSSWLVP